MPGQQQCSKPCEELPRLTAGDVLEDQVVELMLEDTTHMLFEQAGKEVRVVNHFELGTLETTRTSSRNIIINPLFNLTAKQQRTALKQAIACSLRSSSYYPLSTSMCHSICHLFFVPAKQKTQHGWASDLGGERLRSQILERWLPTAPSLAPGTYHVFLDTSLADYHNHRSLAGQR